MKSKLIAVLFFFSCSSSVFSQKEAGGTTRVKAELASFNRIREDAQINVVLYEGLEDRTATIESSDKSAETINLKVIDGELIVTSDNPRKNLKKKVVVSIPVNNLKRIEMNNDAMIVSVSTLKSDKINVAINSECWMKIRLTGILTVDETAGFGYGTITYNDSPLPGSFGGQ